MGNRDSASSSETLEVLVSNIARLTESKELLTTKIPELTLFRWDEPTEPFTGMYEPSLCMVVQGSKRVQLGDDTFVYDPGHYLITSIHLPTMVQVLSASPEEPYLGLTLALDRREISKLMAEYDIAVPGTRQSSRGMATGEVNASLLNAMSRLVGLLDTEEDIPILAPLIKREILYRLLKGENGVRLCQIASAGSQSGEIAQAIRWLRENFSRKLRVDDMASQAGMSRSTFHHHFRTMTSLSPLQYQKQLRLQEARRLMIAERLDAETAGYRVGYSSPSQFSREYSRQFGVPPLRDVSNLRMQVSPG